MSISEEQEEDSKTYIYLIPSLNDTYDNKSNYMYMYSLYPQEASQCLTEHTHRIKLDNRRLRHQLLMLIQQTRALHEHKDKLLV